MFIACPTCKPEQTIGKFSPKREKVSFLCPKCRCEYFVTIGQLSDVVKTAQSSKHNKLSESYYLRLLVAPDNPVAFRFRYPQQKGNLPWHRGDEIAVFECLTQDGYQAIVAIHNFRENRLYQIASLKSRSWKLGLSTGAIMVLLVGLTLTTFFPKVRFSQFLFLSIPIGIVMGTTVRSRTTPCLISSEQEREAESACQLLAQMRQLDSQAKLIEQEKTEQLSLLHDLEHLANLLQQSGIDYAQQVLTVQRALSLVQSQLDLSEEVKSRYDEVLRILEVEYLASQINVTLLAHSPHKISNNLNQIQLLEQERDALKEQLALIPVSVY